MSDTLIRNKFDVYNESGDVGLDEYFDYTIVEMRNAGELPFAGDAAKFQGREYGLNPGEAKSVPVKIVYHFLGNPHEEGDQRRKEHDRLRARYGAAMTMDERDMRRYNEIYAYWSNHQKKAGIAAPTPLNIEGRIPDLVICDPTTHEAVPHTWPLYDSEYEPVDLDGLEAKLDSIPDVSPELRALKAELAEMRKEIGKRDAVNDRRFEELGVPDEDDLD